ncbi:hypothetical protein [Stygiolobus caldivivus]|uniref:Uncharacterized protein n=1 Tax=Stygiolobus caldivivus TaxID=2824673 RepID=A0A8D5U559_9CREN|nr:hypothetical protein [Stygiolobus caldivivus]BCU69700.1 hypothetical protein KN1_09970 [Stygiolobus caldivivus]
MENLNNYVGNLSQYTVSMMNKIGYSKCWKLSTKLITNPEAFLKTLLQDYHAVIVVVGSRENEVVKRISPIMGSNRIPIYLFTDSSLDEEKFILCVKE